MFIQKSIPPCTSWTSLRINWRHLASALSGFPPLWKRNNFLFLTTTVPCDADVSSLHQWLESFAGAVWTNQIKSRRSFDQSNEFTSSFFTDCDDGVSFQMCFTPFHFLFSKSGAFSEKWERGSGKESWCINWLTQELTSKCLR